MVLATTMLMLLLVVLVLSITTVSRRVTARYSYYVGLYDLAVSGNEKALFLLREASYADDVYFAAWARIQNQGVANIALYYDGAGLRMSDHTKQQFEMAFFEELQVRIGETFTHVPTRGYMLNWQLNAMIDINGAEITDTYSATTSLSFAGTQFNVSTRIHRYIDNIAGHYTLVEAAIIWDTTGYREISLDAYTINGLVQQGVISHIVPGVGENMVLFLDEFAFAMVQSLRIAGLIWIPSKTL